MSEVLRRIQTVFSIDDNDHNRKLKEIRAEYQLTAEKIKTMDSVMDSNGKTVESLSQKQKLLVKNLQEMRDYQTHYEKSIQGTNDKLTAYKNRVAELNTLKAKLKKTIDDETKAHGENSAEVKEAQLALDGVNRELGDLNGQINKSEGNIKKYTLEVEKSKQNQEKLAEQIQKTTLELAKQENKFYQTGLKAQEYGKKIAGIGKGMTKVGTAANRYISLPIAGAGIAAIKMATDFETAFVGVTKTIEAADVPGGYEAIKESIRTLAKEIPATHEAIAGVVEVAGQLGIQGGSIMKFTKVMIDLGETTDMVSNEAAASLAKFANITGMQQDDFDRLGSTIVDLGNNFAATESEIVNMGLRLSAAGTQAGLSENEIMALSAGLTSLGLEAEAGGSAFSKLMVRIKMATVTGGPDLEKLSKVAGMTGAEFRKAFEEDASEALLMFMQGLAEADKTGKGALATLVDLGIEEIRMRDATLRAAGGVDVLASALDKSGTAWTNNNALMEEANKRYASSESQMKISMNRIKDVAIDIGEKILPTVLRLAEGVAELVESFADLDPATQDMLIKFAGIAAASGPVLKGVGGITFGIGKLTEAFGKHAVKVAEASLKQAAFIGPMPKAASTIASLGPAAGIAALGIAGLTAAVWLATAPHRKYNDNIKDTIDGVKEFADEVKKATPIISNFNDAGTTFDESINGKRSKVAKLEPEITKIFSINVKERNKLTDSEISKINEYMKLLDTLNQEVIDKYGVRLNVAIEKLNKEGKLNSDSAKEYLATAALYDKELTDYAEKTYEDKLVIIQNGIETEKNLRLLGNYEGAKQQKAHNDAMRIEAEKAYNAELEEINKGTLALVQATADKYILTNKEELEGLRGLSWIREDEIKLIKDYNARKEEIWNDSSMTESEKAVADSALWEWHERNLREHKLRENWVWDKSAKETAAALMYQVNSVILHGGKINDETAGMVNGIVSSMGRVPENAEYFKTMLKESLNAIVKSEPELRDEADALVKNFDEVFATLPDGKYETGAQMVEALMRGIKSVGVTTSIKEISDAIDEHLDIMNRKTKTATPAIVQPMKDAIPTIEEFAAKLQLEPEAVEKSIGKIATSFRMTETEVMLAIDAWGGNIEEFAEMHGKNVTKIEESVKDMAAITTSGFTKIEQNSTIGMKTYMDNVKKNGEATASWAKNTEKLMKAGVSEGAIKELAKMGPAGAEQADRWVKQLEKMNKGSLKEFEKNNKQTKTFINKFNETYITSLEEVDGAVRTQFAAMDYGGEAAFLIGQFIAGMISELPYMKEMAEKLGYEAGQYTSFGVEKSSPLAKQEAADLRTDMLNELGEMPFEAGKVGEKSGLSAADGLTKSRLPGRIAARNLKAEMMNELGELPFEAEKTGESAGNKAAEAIEAKTPKAKNRAAALKNAILDEIGKLPPKGRTNGERFVDGVADGINDKAYLAINAASRLAGRTETAFRKRLQIYSPSRVMRKSGQNIAEGVALGIQDDAMLVEQAMNKLAAVPMSAVAMANPTITKNENVSRDYKNTVDINVNINGSGSEVLRNDPEFAEKIKSIVLTEIVVGNRAIPNRTSILGI